MSLSDGYMESGHVDVIRAVSSGGIFLLVTTVPLMQSWLRVNTWWAPLPQDPATSVGKALGDGAFYTQALACDATVNIYADVALPPGAGGAVMRALLTRKAQDSVAPSPPDGLIVSEIRGERVFIFDKPFKTALPVIPVCETPWTAESKRIEPMFVAAANASDTAAVEKAQALADKAELRS